MTYSYNSSYLNSNSSTNKSKTKRSSNISNLQNPYTYSFQGYKVTDNANLYLGPEDWANRYSNQTKYSNNHDFEVKPSRPNNPPRDWKYNLPPHSWSLPLRPAPTYNVSESGSGSIHNKNLFSEDIHATRRGVIWNFDTGANITKVDDSGNYTTWGQANTSTSTKTDTGKSDAKISEFANNYNYGFQFLWNPEAISSSVERNMEVTPSPADKFRTVAGAFPGQESYSFSIVLDRVNDFACIRALTNKIDVVTGSAALPDSNALPNNLINYYANSLYTKTETEIKQQIYDLSKYGTMADLEYLFKAINGDGISTDNRQGWTTLLGKPTAAIGFLSPTLLGFRFGRDVTKQLSFVGWITSLSLSHTYFTEEMIPLRTTVNFSCQAFAGSSII